MVVLGGAGGGEEKQDGMERESQRNLHSVSIFWLPSPSSAMTTDLPCDGGKNSFQVFLEKKLGGLTGQRERQRDRERSPHHSDECHAGRRIKFDLQWKSKNANVIQPFADALPIGLQAVEILSPPPLFNARL